MIIKQLTATSHSNDSDLHLSQWNFALLLSDVQLLIDASLLRENKSRCGVKKLKLDGNFPI